MTKHKICKGCKFNHYPYCHGTILDNGEYMPINNRKSGFECGQKDLLEPFDFSIVHKSALELKVEDLQNQIDKLKEVK